MAELLHIMLTCFNLNYLHVSKNNSGLPCVQIVNLIFVYDFIDFSVFIVCLLVFIVCLFISKTPKMKMHTHASDITEIGAMVGFVVG